MTYTFDSQKDGPFDFLNGLYRGSPIVNVIPLQWEEKQLSGWGKDAGARFVTEVTKAIIITSP